MTGHPQSLSPLVDRLRESATIRATRRARELARAGHDILQISGGEPDFDTPDHIKAAAKAAIDAGMTKYTPTDGTAELKEAVVAKLRRDNGIDVPPRQVVIGTGAKQLIFNALISTISDGDEAIIPTPSWVSYSDIVELAGGKPVLVQCPRAAGYKITPGQLRSALTERTRWLILNSPGNPSGAVYSAGELRALADVLLEHPDVLVLSDEVYEYILFDGRKFASIAAVEPRLAERTLTVNGVSKGFCMTGWRIGYCAAPQWLVPAMVKLQGQETNGPSSISQAAAVAALTGPLDFVERHNSAYQRRRDMVVAAINATVGLSCDPPEGAFYVYVDASGLIGRRDKSGRVMASDLDIAEHLLAAGVAVVPGAGFHASPFFRLCFAYEDGILREACRRIARACEELTD